MDLHTRAVAVVATVTVLLLACNGGYGKPSTPTSTGAPAGASTDSAPGAIRPSAIQAFTLESFTIPAGTTVEWTNRDAPTRHTVTFEDGAVDSGSLAATPFQHTFSTPGAFPYFCKIHPSMTATVTVQ